MTRTVSRQLSPEHKHEHISAFGFMAKIADGRYGKGEQLIVCQMPFHMGKLVSFPAGYFFHYKSLPSYHRLHVIIGVDIVHAR
ncbi:hypothetical protein F511_29720 [Dorcoceras hygrometricum]|uniref:Uncharacterized protein n=1 Tax=Dorcoceras hygrometricum TaxID=472368 RepID=A0A2Z7AZY8_9LAMI|nr:hypothetical protein F511_29720 [Dorcoceras hygrometricum]